MGQSTCSRRTVPQRMEEGFHLSLSRWERVGVRACRVKTPIDNLLSLNATRRERRTKKEIDRAASPHPRPFSQKEKGERHLSLREVSCGFVDRRLATTIKRSTKSHEMPRKMLSFRVGSWIVLPGKGDLRMGHQRNPCPNFASTVSRSQSMASALGRIRILRIRSELAG